MLVGDSLTLEKEPAEENLICCAVQIVIVIALYLNVSFFFIGVFKDLKKI